MIASNIIMLLTDGRASEVTDTKFIHKSMTELKIKLFIVGIGRNS